MSYTNSLKKLLKRALSSSLFLALNTEQLQIQVQIQIQIPEKFFTRPPNVHALRLNGI